MSFFIHHHVVAFVHCKAVCLCWNGGEYRNQVDTTRAGPAAWQTWERGHVLGRVAVVIDAEFQGVGKLGSNWTNTGFCARS
jgi:hypothetical protein